MILILLFRHDPYFGGPAGQFATDSYVPFFADGYPTIHRALDPTWYAQKLLPNGSTSTLTFSFLLAVCF